MAFVTLLSLLKAHFTAQGANSAELFVISLHPAPMPEAWPP